MPRPQSEDLPPDQPTVFYRDVGHSRIVRRIAPLRLLVWICLLVATILLGWTIAARPLPDAPAVIYFGACVLPMALYVLRHSRGQNMRALKVFLFLATLYGAPLLAWNVSLYRGMVFAVTWKILPDQQLLTTINDRSDWVGAMACERLLRDPSLVHEELIMRVLEFRPALAERCLGAVGDRQPSLSHKLATHVTQRWYRDWMNSTLIPPEHGCASAGVFAAISAHRRDNGAAHLLHCALGAAQEEVSQCCRVALNEGFSAAQLPEVDPTRLAESVRSELFFQVTARLTEVNQVGTRAGAEPGLIESPGWLLHWAVTLGCNLVYLDHRPDHMAAEMALMTRSECNIDVQDTLYPFETTRLIRQTCEPLRSEEWFGQVDQYEWCTGVRRAAQYTAINAASFMVAQAITNLEYRGVAANIHIGVSRRDRLHQMQGPLRLEHFGGGFDGALSNTHIIAQDLSGWTEGRPRAAQQDPREISYGKMADRLRTAREGIEEEEEDSERTRRLDSILNVLESRQREGSGTLDDAFRRFESP